MGNKPKINWMLDESIARSKPSEWGRVVALEQKLVNLIGNPKFEHVLPNPIDGLTKIIGELKNQKFTSIIDLTGWLSPSLKSLFSSTPIVNEFSLSRVRVVSSVNLETSGYTVTMNQSEIRDLKKTLNMEKTLIVDDTTFTGWTNLKTMELWGLDPKLTTHAFLIGNTGMLDENHGIHGAVRNLESQGSRVFFGHELSTPKDDGWHLKDLHQHSNLDKAFDMGITLLKLIEDEGPESGIVKSFIRAESVLNTIFPNRLTTSQIRELSAEGKFIQSGKVDLTDDDLVHTKNPLLWASRYFAEHIDLPKIVNHRNEIKRILTELKTLTDDPEVKHEAASELRNIAQRRVLFEGIQARGHER